MPGGAAAPVLGKGGRVAGWVWAAQEAPARKGLSTRTVTEHLQGPDRPGAIPGLRELSLSLEPPPSCVS